MNRRVAWLGFANITEYLALALMIGGMLALGAFVAPAVFGHFPRAEAGLVMTSIFRRYDGVIAVCLGLVLLAEGVRLTLVGDTRTMWARVRYGVVTLLVGLTAYSLFAVNPRIEAYQQAGVRRGVGIEGQAFDRLHHRSEQLYKIALLLAMVLLGLLAMPRSLNADESLG